MQHAEADQTVRDLVEFRAFERVSTGFPAVELERYVARGGPTEGDGRREVPCIDRRPDRAVVAEELETGRGDREDHGYRQHHLLVGWFTGLSGVATRLGHAIAGMSGRRWLSCNLPAHQ